MEVLSIFVWHNRDKRFKVVEIPKNNGGKKDDSRANKELLFLFNFRPFLS
jgi:hypothetical protein